MAQKIDLTGRRFERLLVESCAGSFRDKGTGRLRINWNCLCDCGSSIIVEGNALKRQKSCGCQKLEAIAAINKSHNLSKSSEYECWQNMKRRCADKSRINYGAKGIKVCGRWLNSFENFIADMGLHPFPNATIERKDNNADYCPENCYRASKSEQGKNTSGLVYITWKGETKYLSEWERHLGFKPGALKKRINRLNWSIERAFTQPVRRVQKFQI